MVMPEIGLELDPTSPVNREETVTKRNPKTKISPAPSKFIRRAGASVMAAISTNTPPATQRSERSRSRRSPETPDAPSRAPAKSANPARKVRHSVGIDFNKLTRPPAATAPAPM